MAETRLRGQEVTIRLARGGQVADTLTAVKDFTAQLDLATQEEGYLGETTTRKDMIFNGISGSFTLDAEGAEFFRFISFIKETAQRQRNPNEARVNVTARFSFPNGESPRLIVRDLQFDAIPIATPSRDGYVNASFSYKAEDATVLTT